MPYSLFKKSQRAIYLVLLFCLTFSKILFAKLSNLGKKFKGYYWDQNYGYGTKKHLKAIKKLGITAHHRKTFSPINKIK